MESQNNWNDFRNFTNKFELKSSRKFKYDCDSARTIEKKEVILCSY